MSVDTLPPAPLPPGMSKNIAAVMQIEQEFLKARSRGDRVGDRISRLAGSLVFVVVHVAVVAGWLLVNMQANSDTPPLDPFPFSLLALIVSMEAVFLTIFVLMSQNRQNKQADHRAHLHLQIGLLAEQESTKIIQLLHQVCQHLGVETAAHDKEVKELAGRTAVRALADELTNHLQETHRGKSELTPP